MKIDNRAKTVLLRLAGLLLEPQEAAQEDVLLAAKAAFALQIAPDQVCRVTIRKKSLDARDRERLHFVYTLDVLCRTPVSGRVRGRGLSLTRPEAPVVNQAAVMPKPGRLLHFPPVVVGAGPAGLFAALELAEAGYRPLIIEQGQAVEQRVRDVARFWREGSLDPWSNVQFGEGGAGTFSDGKLTFRGKDAKAQKIIATFVELGAPAENLYWHKPHLGSDALQVLLPRLRKRIEQAGGRFLFGCRLVGLELERQAGQRLLAGLRLDERAGQRELPVQAAILAPGNGARATYEMLEQAGVALAAKPFAVGLRIEHAQSFIDQTQYGGLAGQPALPPAEYLVKYQAAGQRHFYSFCMCPGGQIVNAASESGGLLTNGISMAARASGKANSALVGAVTPGLDFADEPLAGVAWQRQLEQAAFQAGGGDYALPACLVEDFLRGSGANLPADFAPLSPGVRAVELRPLLPEALAAGLAEALTHWDRQLPGFAAHAVLAGLETRTSAPLRVLRGADRQSVNLAGLYPAGEGAGYAGGIVSSAIDGLNAAAAIIAEYAPPLAVT